MTLLIVVQAGVSDTEMETSFGPESQFPEDGLYDPAGEEVYEPSDESVGTRKRKKLTSSVPVSSTRSEDHDQEVGSCDG
jgi:hypothetical protein